MPIPANIYALSTTPASNSPGGGESAILADDYLREWAAYIALLRDVVLSGTSSLTTLNLAYTGTLTGGAGIVNLGSGQFYKDASGNVGIGTSAPISPLQIRSDSATDLTIIRANNNTSSAVVGSGLHLGYSAADFYGYRLTNYNNPGATSAGLFKLQRGTTTAWVDVLVSNNAGNIGIGTSSPVYKFVVSNTGANGLEIDPVSGAGTGINSYNRSTSAYTAMSVAALSHTWLAGATATAAMTIDNSGNTMIGGVTNPNSARLHVTASTGQNIASFVQQAVGGYCAQFDAFNASSAYYLQLFKAGGTATGSITSNGTTTSYTTTSDHRLKENPQPLTGSGEFIDALQPKTWRWKRDNSVGTGFLAHEVAEVSPGSVVGAKDAVDADGVPIMQSVAYGSAEFIAHLVAELQTLRRRVAALDAATSVIEDLRARVATLEAAK